MSNKKLLTQNEAKSIDEKDIPAIIAESSINDALCKLRCTPRIHQWVSVIWAFNRKNVLFLHDIGTGKTLSAILTCMSWQCRNVLVVCPNSVRYTWMNEVKKHTTYDAVELVGTEEERMSLMQKSKDIMFHVVNYEGLKYLFASKFERKVNKKIVNQYDIDDAKLGLSYYDALIVDECHHCRNPESLQTRLCAAIARRASNTILLTATPTRKDIIDFWGSCFVLDGGLTLGDDYFTFLHQYFSKYTVRRGHIPLFDIWTPKAGATDEILDKIAETSLRYTAKECTDLPELTQMRRYIEMSPEQRKMTTSILKGLKVELDKGVLTIKNVLNQGSKLSQIASGFVIGSGGPEIFKRNPKLDELLGLLTELGDIKSIIVHSFVEEARMIESRLKKEKIEYASLRGEIKNKMGQLDKFILNPDVRTLICHPASGGEGLNLQVANVIIFFSSPYSGLLREQMIGRVHRSGQTKNCVVIDLIVHDSENRESISIDEHRVLSSVSDADAAKRLLDWIKSC